VMLWEGGNCLADWISHVVLNNLLTFLLNQEVTIVLTHLAIDTCREADNRLWTWVANINANEHSSLFA
jgi:hypothetical protein